MSSFPKLPSFLLLILQISKAEIILFCWEGGKKTTLLMFFLSGLLYYFSGLGFLNHESQRKTPLFHFFVDVIMQHLLSLGTEKPICLKKVKRNILKGKDKNYLYRKKDPLFLMAKLCVRIICKGGKSTKEKMNCLDPGD